MAIVQTVTANGGAYTDHVAATLGNTTTGDLMVVAVAIDQNTVAVTSIVDSQSNTYTKIGQAGYANSSLEVWYAKNITGGTTPTLTVSINAGTFHDIVVIAREYSGIDTTAPLDKSVVAADGGFLQSHTSGATAATTTANELVVGFIAGDSSTPATVAGSGYGNLSTKGGFDSFTFASIEDKTVAATGAQTATFSTTPFTQGGVGVATFKLSASSNLTKTQTGTARVSAAVTKTQTAVSRISKTGNTKTQPAVGRISKAFTLTQSAVARVAKAFAKTQTSVARISAGVTKTQSATARVVNTATKTQAATARITESITKTQSGVGRVQKAFTKTQGAIARIAAGFTKTQTAVSRISKVGLTSAQTAVARVVNTASKTQSAVARVAKSFTKSQSGVSRIQISSTKTQAGVSRIQISSTKTQTAVARVQKSFTLTQSAISRIAKSFISTLTGVSRIATAPTKTQSATARVTKSGITKTQTATARITEQITKTQTATGRLTKALTKTQAGVANIIVGTVITKTQTAVARISKALTFTQSAVTRISKAFTKTQSAIARISKGLTSTQSGVARIQVTATKTQGGLSRIINVVTKTQTATGRIRKALTATQAGTARIQNVGVQRLNLVVNPSFETGSASWSEYHNPGPNPATVTVDNTVAFIGSQSLKILTAASGNSYAGVSINVGGVAVGKQYTVSVYVKGAVGGENFNVYPSTSGQVDINLTTGWTRFTETFTATAQSQMLYFRSSTASATFWIDAVLVEQGSDTKPYFDGSTPGGLWTGTAHASTSVLSGAVQTGTARVANTGMQANLVANGLFDNIPALVATQTSTIRWIDGTAAGSATNTYHWFGRGINAGNTVNFDTTNVRGVNGQNSLHIGVVSAPNAVEISNDVGNTYNTPPGQGLILKPKTKYQLSGWMMLKNVAGDSSNGATFALLGAKSDGTNITNYSPGYTKVNQGWTYYSTTFTTNIADALGHIELRWYGHTGTGTLTGDAYFSEIQLQEVGANQIAVARITEQITTNTTGTGRIQKVITKLQTAIANIAHIFSTDQIGITFGSGRSTTQTGVSRIRATVTKTQMGTARIIPPPGPTYPQPLEVESLEITLSRAPDDAVDTINSTILMAERAPDDSTLLDESTTITLS